jgi:predicted nuclease with TOPRIM domain
MRVNLLPLIALVICFTTSGCGKAREAFEEAKNWKEKYEEAMKLKESAEKEFERIKLELADSLEKNESLKTAMARSEEEIRMLKHSEVRLRDTVEKERKAWQRLYNE